MSRKSLKEARSRALGDLASEIEVHVRSEVESLVEERGHSGRSSDSQVVTRDTWAVRLLAQQTIRDPEWVGNWAGEGEYWSYARLSKTEFRDGLEKELREARQLANDHLRAARRLENRGEVLGAAREYVRGLQSLRTFFGRPIGVDSDGGIDLGNALRRGVDRTAGAIEIERQGEGMLLVATGRGVADELTVGVRYEGMPLAGVPVAFEFTQGAGSLLSPVQSDSRGRARSRVSRIDGSGTHVIEARVDLAALALGDAEVDPGLEELLRQTGLRAVEYHIGGVSKRLHIQVTETSLGRPAQDPYFTRILESRLADEGAVRFVADGEEADLLLVGTARTRFSSQVGAVVFCYADVSVRLIDVETETELYASRQKAVKGADKSKRDAADRAMEKAAEQVVDDLLRVIRTEVQP